MGIQGNSKIFKYLLKNNTTDLEISDKLTDSFIEFDYLKYPGISLCYLKSRGINNDDFSWNEYNILFSVLKYKDTPEYLSYILKNLSELIENISKRVSIDVIGIDEIDGSQPNYYYILLYILSDGKEKEKIYNKE